MDEPTVVVDVSTGVDAVVSVFKTCTLVDDSDVEEDSMSEYLLSVDAVSVAVKDEENMVDSVVSSAETVLVVELKCFVTDFCVLDSSVVVNSNDVEDEAD